MTLKLAEHEAAYVAGFFDGEGTVNYYNSSLRVSISQKDRTVLDWLCSIYGGGVNCRPNGVHVWWVNGAGSFAFLSEVGPYLRIKVEQVREAINKAIANKSPSRIDDLEELKERKARYIQAYQETLHLQAQGMSVYAIGKHIVAKYGVKGKCRVERWLAGEQPMGWKETQAC